MDPLINKKYITMSHHSLEKVVNDISRMFLELSIGISHQ